MFIVYIREAHPTDGRQVEANRQDEVLFPQPKSFGERSEIAEQMCSELKLSLPCLIDGLDNRVGEAYSGWPDRIYVIGLDGRIVYKGEPGPHGFRPDEAAKALEKYLAEAE